MIQGRGKSIILSPSHPIEFFRSINRLRVNKQLSRTPTLKLNVPKSPSILHLSSVRFLLISINPDIRKIPSLFLFKPINQTCPVALRYYFPRSDLYFLFSANLPAADVASRKKGLNFSHNLCVNLRKLSFGCVEMKRDTQVHLNGHD